ncbi:MAG: DUF1801 domain-containing protein [Polyangiales bacterium]
MATAKRTKKPAATKKAAKKAPQKKAARSKMPARRADFGAPTDGFFAKQPPTLRAILQALRALVEEIAPEATASIKWGMPFYAIGGETVCALAGFKSHVNLILPGAPDTFEDPDGLLEGDGKTGRHLKLRSLDELPREAVRGWLRTTAKAARKQA